MINAKVPYPRAVGAADRRSAFGRPDEEYSRGFEYDGPRFYPNGAPRGYHGEDQRGYHGDGLHFANEQRSGPPARRQEDPYSYYRGAREDPLPGRQMDFRPSGRAIPPPSVRVQGSYPPPPPRPLSAVGPDPGDDTLMRAILNLDRGEDREALRRKGPYPPALREHSPLRKDVPPSPHSRSGSSVSSRSYSPDRAKGHAYQPPQSTRYEEPYGPNRAPDRDRVSGPSVSASRDGSPQSSVSVSKMSLENSSISLETLPGPKAEGLEKSSAATEAGGDPVREEGVVAEGPPDEALPATDEISTLLEDFHERRAQAISAKAREIEKVYRQDCETFGMVVKMLVAKEPSLEKHLQSPLKENLGEIRDRCLEDLRHFISELDEVVRQPEPSV